MTRGVFSGLVVVGMLFFTGCSDKSSNKMISGRVIDHYIQGASVYTPSGVKANKPTDEWGAFTIEETGEPLIAEGGKDIATKEEFIGKLKAPAGSKIINSLTNEVQAAIEEKGKSLGDAKKYIKSKFDLPNIDITSYDPIEGLVNNPNSQDAKDTLARQAQVQAVLNATAKALKEHANADPKKAFEEASVVILETINSPKDVEKPETIEKILESTAKEVGVKKEVMNTLATKADDFAVKMVDVIKVIEDAKDEDAEKLVKTVEAAVKVAEKVAEEPEKVQDVKVEVNSIEKNITVTLPPKDIYEEGPTTGAEG